MGNALPLRPKRHPLPSSSALSRCAPAVAVGTCKQSNDPDPFCPQRGEERGLGGRLERGERREERGERREERGERRHKWRILRREG